ncbi:MAG: hypothetical protein ACK5AO_03980 [bacterium]
MKNYFKILFSSIVAAFYLLLAFGSNDSGTTGGTTQADYSEIIRCNTCNKELYGPKKNRVCSYCDRTFTNWGYTYLYNEVGYEHEVSNWTECGGVSGNIHNGKFWKEYAEHFVCCSYDCAIDQAKSKGIFKGE